MVDTIVRDENKVTVALLRCRTMCAGDVAQLETQSEIFEGDALEMVVFPFLRTGEVVECEAEYDLLREGAEDSQHGFQERIHDT